MSHKLRSVNTHFWDDSFVVTLDPIEKLLFLYVLTNPLTTVAGVYEVSLRRIAFDTGIDSEMVQKILGRFADQGKITYRDGWIVIHNFLKNQKMNPNVEKGAVNALSDCPVWVYETLSKALKGFASLREVKDKVKAKTKDKDKDKTEDENGSVCDDDAPQDYVDEVLNGIRKTLKTNILTKETEWIDLCDDTHRLNIPASAVLDCFGAMARQDWRTGRISAKAVLDNLENLERLKEQERENARQQSKPDSGKEDRNPGLTTRFLDRARSS